MRYASLWTRLIAERPVSNDWARRAYCTRIGGPAGGSRKPNPRTHGGALSDRDTPEPWPRNVLAVGIV